MATITSTLYHIGDEHRSRYIDGKWGVDGSTPSIMATFVKLCGKAGASEAKLRAHCASVGNKGFFAYALRNGWLVAIGDAPVTKTPAQRAKTRDGDTSATKPAKASKGKKGSKGQSPADSSPASLVGEANGIGSESPASESQS